MVARAAGSGVDSVATTVILVQKTISVAKGTEDCVVFLLRLGRHRDVLVTPLKSGCSSAVQR